MGSGNGLAFRVTYSKQSFTWDVTGPKGFYLATRDEALAEGIRALLEEKMTEAQSFVHAYLQDKGLIPCSP